MKRFLAIAAALLQGCVYLPRTETVYVEKCNVYARQMTLQIWQAERFPVS